MNSAEKIRKLMNEQGYSAYRLSKMTGVSESAIGRFLNGVSEEPRLSTLTRIAEALAVPLAEIADRPSLPRKLRKLESGPLVPLLEPSQLPDFIRGDEETLKYAKRMRFPYALKTDTAELSMLVAMRIKDNAMAPYYLPNDIVFFSALGFSEAPFCGDNFHVACLIDGKGAVRKAENGDGDDIWLTAVNPEWKGEKSIKNANMLGRIICLVRGLRLTV